MLDFDFMGYTCAGANLLKLGCFSSTAGYSALAQVHLIKSPQFNPYIMVYDFFTQFILSFTISALSSLHLRPRRSLSYLFACRIS